MRAIFVFCHMAFVKAERAFNGPSMHFANIDATIPRAVQIADPAVVPPLVIAEHSVGVGICSREQRGARGAARRRCDVHPVKTGSLIYQTVQIWRINMRKTKCRYCVVSLLIGQDEDDIGLIGHYIFPLTARC
nr:hypothetical protein [Pseudorhodobacter wandonensis]